MLWGMFLRSFGSAKTVYASDETRNLLEQNGLADLDAVFAQGASARGRHTGRTVWDTRLRCSMPHPDIPLSPHLLVSNGSDEWRVMSDEPETHHSSLITHHWNDATQISEVRVFVKMQWGRRRLWPRMNDLKTGQTFQTLPLREWHGLLTLKALGLNVPRPLALYHDGLWRFRSAVLMTAVPPSASVEDMIRHGEWSDLDPGDREALFDAMLKALETIHAAGLGWRGTSSRHFFPQRVGDGTWSVWLIDCEGIHSRATRRTVDRNLRKLVRSFQQTGADAETLRLLEEKIDQRRT